MYEGKFKSVAQRGYDNMSDIPFFRVPGRKSPSDAKSYEKTPPTMRERKIVRSESFQF